MQLSRYTDTKHALGGPVTLTIIGEMPQDTATELITSLWRDILYFEKKFSRFLPSSELTRFNKKAGIRVPISPAMRAILVATKQCADNTNDLYNPFILPALQRTGYKESATAKYATDTAPDYTDRQVVASSQLEIGDTWAQIPRDTAIDLGGMGKGYLADQLAEKLSKTNLAGYWIELSGDIVTFGYDENGLPISVGIQDAENISQKRGDFAAVGDGGVLAIATSGTFRRSTQSASKLQHHIIDPRTGGSAKTDMLLATVCASSALLADIAASCAVIVGSQQAPELMKRMNAPSWVLQYKQNNGGIEHSVHGPHIKGRNT